MVSREDHGAQARLWSKEDDVVVKLLPWKRDEAESFVVTVCQVLRIAGTGEQCQRQYQAKHER